jgi:hypothetical protein
MSKSYYEPSQKKSLFDLAFETGARTVASHLVGDFFDKVPEELTFAAGQESKQISAINSAEINALNELTRMSNAISTQFLDLAKIDGMSDDDADSMLAKNYANYDEAFLRLMSDDNIKYFDIGNPDADGNLAMITGSSDVVRDHAKNVYAEYQNARKISDFVSTQYAGLKEMKTGVQKARKRTQAGFYDIDQKTLNDAIDKVENLLMKNHATVGGKQLINKDILQNQSDKYIDWLRASHKARQKDVDLKTPGIQFSKEVLKDKGRVIDLSNTKDFSKAVQEDLQKYGIMTTGDGTSITYGEGALLIDRLFKDNQPARAGALLDKMLPSGGEHTRKEKLRKIQQSELITTNQQADRVAKQLEKEIKWLTAQAKTLEEQTLKGVNSAQTMVNQHDGLSIDNIVSELGGSGVQHSQIGENQIKKIFNLWPTDDFEQPKYLRPFVNGIKNYLSHFQESTTKWTGTVDNPEVLFMNFSKRQQQGSAKDLLKILAYTSPDFNGWRGGKGGGVVVKMGKKIDKNGKPVDDFQSLQFADIDRLSDETAYKALKENRDPGSLLWLLGFGIGDDLNPETNKEYTIEERAKLVDDRAKSLKYKKAHTHFTGDMLKGAEGRVIIQLAEHWNEREKIISGIVDNEVLDRWKENSYKSDLYEGFATGIYKNLTPEENKLIENALNAVKVADGEATSKNVGGEEIITEKIPKLTDKDLLAVKEKIKESYVPPIDVKEEERLKVSPAIQQMKLTLANEMIASGADSTAVQDSLKNITSEVALKNLVSNIITPKEPKEVKETDFPETDIGEYLDPSTEVAQVVAGDVDKRREKVKETDPLMTSLANLGEDIEVTPSTKTVLNDLEIASIVPDKNIMDRVNKLAPNINIPDKKELTTREDLVNMELVDSTGKDIDFNNPVKFKKQISGIVAKIKSLNKAIGGSATQKNRKSLVMEAQYWLDILKSLNINIESLGDKIQVPSKGTFATASRDSRFLKETMSEISGLLSGLEETAKWMY